MSKYSDWCAHQEQAMSLRVFKNNLYRNFIINFNNIFNHNHMSLEQRLYYKNKQILLTRNIVYTYIFLILTYILSTKNRAAFIMLELLVKQKLLIIDLNAYNVRVFIRSKVGTENSNVDSLQLRGSIASTYYAIPDVIRGGGVSPYISTFTIS